MPTPRERVRSMIEVAAAANGHAVLSGTLDLVAEDEGIDAAVELVESLTREFGVAIAVLTDGETFIAMPAAWSAERAAKAADEILSTVEPIQGAVESVEFLGRREP